jgi:hypothetical protein
MVHECKKIEFFAASSIFFLYSENLRSEIFNIEFSFDTRGGILFTPNDSINLEDGCERCIEYPHPLALTPTISPSIEMRVGDEYNTLTFIRSLQLKKTFCFAYLCF